MWSINSARKKLFCIVIVKNYLCNISHEFFYQTRKQVEAWNQRTNNTADFTYCGTTVRSSHRRCSIKKMFLKFHNIHRKHLYWSLFLILPILKNILKRLLFNFCNGWLLYRPKLLRSRFYAGFRLQGSTYRSKFFVFKSASLVLKRFPTCIQKPKTYTFDKSIKFLHWLFLVILDGFRSF